jgi:hypothetical protein
MGSQGVEIIGCRIVGAAIARSDNHPGIRVEYNQTTNDVRTLIQDCVISGFVQSPADGNALNHPAIQVYHKQNVTIEYCTLSNCSGAGIFVKDADGEKMGGHVFRFNRIFGTGYAGIYLRDVGHESPTSAVPTTTLVHQNLIYSISSTAQSAILLSNNPGINAPRYISIYNNTIYGAPQYGIGSGNGPGATYDFQNITIRDNLVSGAISAYLCTSLAAKEARGMVTRNDVAHNLSNQFVYLGSCQIITGSPFVTPGSDFTLNTTAGAGAVARVASTTAGPVGCYITGSETIGCRL